MENKTNHQLNIENNFDEISNNIKIALNSILNTISSNENIFIDGVLRDVLDPIYIIDNKPMAIDDVDSEEQDLMIQEMEKKIDEKTIKDSLIDILIDYLEEIKYGR